MNFTQWLKELDKQTTRYQELPLVDISESISLSSGELITIDISSDCTAVIAGIGLGIGGVPDAPGHPRYLRPYYTNNKEEFDDLLESITNQITMVAVTAEAILNNMTDAAVPAAVLARIQGARISGDRQELLKTHTNKLLISLVERLEHYLPIKGLTTGTFVLGEISGRDILLTLGPHVTFTWGKLTVFSEYTSGFNLRDAIFFLANYEYIITRCIDFMKDLRELLEEVIIQ